MAKRQNARARRDAIAARSASVRARQAPDDGSVRDSEPVTALTKRPVSDAAVRQAVIGRLWDLQAERDLIERQVAEAITAGRAAGLSWERLAAPLEATGETLRRRYGDR